jgi:hypothetical protein
VRRAVRRLDDAGGRGAPNVRVAGLLGVPVSPRAKLFDGWCVQGE